MSYSDSFSKWLKLKIYQIEVTFSVYIFTPVEKFIFWSVFFLLTSLTMIATILYLPRHLAFIIGRAWFYMNGDSADAADLSKCIAAAFSRTWAAFANNSGANSTGVIGALSSATAAVTSTAGNIAIETVAGSAKMEL
ncbi:hypothetical protein VTK73DRAFT_8437 [Phialemonium thermophilum]|uniref:Uncharacterized protein n=1 Tax=Phialemonium thermophilum TaxID=223376 RepID=A0ABR3XNP9_9PEZI